MGTGVVVGDLFAVTEVGWIRAEAEKSRRDWGRKKRRAGHGDAAAGEGARATVGPTRAATGKRRGEMAEAAFMAKVSALGMGVAKTWGDSDRYDFIVDAGKKLRRVQVKSAHRAGQDGGYSLRLYGHSGNAYRGDEIDALVAYIVPVDAWYVFPVAVFGRVRSLKLFPGSVRKRSRFERYREAWGILRGGNACE